MEEDSFEFESESGVRDLIEKYENMIPSESFGYFDTFEFELLFFHYYDNEEFDKALKLINIAISQHSSESFLHVLKSKSLLLLHDIPKALDELVVAEEIDEECFEIYLQRAFIMNMLRRYSEADEAYEKAMELGDEYEETYFEVAAGMKMRGDFEEAIKHLNKCLELNPENMEAVLDLLFCLESGKGTARAIDYATSYLDDYPYSEEVWYALGDLYIKDGNIPEAESAFEFCLAIDETYPYGYVGKGVANMKKGKFSEALVWFSKSLEQGLQNDPFIHFHIGDCYENLELHEKSLASFNKSHQCDPSFGDSLYSMAVVLMQLDRDSESLYYARKLLDINPGNPTYWQLLGDIQLKIGYIEECKFSYKQTIDLSPEDWEVWLNYSHTIYTHESINSAIETLVQGLKVNPEIAELNMMFGSFLFKAGRSKEGLEYIARGLEINHEKSEIIFEYFPEFVLNDDILELVDLYKKTI